jgi:hypothetical protein
LNYLKVSLAGVSIAMNVQLVVTAQVDKHPQKALAIQSIVGRFGLLRNVDGPLPVGHEFADTTSRQDRRFIADAVENFVAIQINQHTLENQWNVNFEKTREV